ncbi:MAG TPA: alpha/beta hydrolase [Acidimicrobiia bacterium]|nr:alpha/beta hydrolase [Acidimicrobiia bacterium]
MTDTSAHTTPDGTLTFQRSIRVPPTVSAHAQAVIAGGHAMVVDRLTNPPSSPALDDAAAWKAQIAATDEFIITGFAANALDVPATVEAREIAGVHVNVITPEGVDAGEDAPIQLDIHGGALIAGGGEACKLMNRSTAARAWMHTWGVDYRMPPDHPYPTPLDDCVAVYRALLEVRPPEKIVVGGGSAGGNLVAAMLLRAKDEGLPMPAALVAMTPEIDLTESGDTFDTNAGVDYVLVDRLTDSIALYAGDHDLTHPYLSPIFGDLTGFPPTFVQAGTRDLFLSNAVRFHRKLRDSGVDAELHVWEAMPHGGFFGAPEDAEIAVEVRRFLAKHL